MDNKQLIKWKIIKTCWTKNKGTLNKKTECLLNDEMFEVFFEELIPLFKEIDKKL